MNRAIDRDVDARIDAYHAGYQMHRDGLPRPTDTDEAEGWDARAVAVRVRVVMPERPEGYYHAPIGTFEEGGAA